MKIPRLLIPVLIVLILRLFTLFVIFPGARHGFTQDQLSAAIGLLEGAGLTRSWSEMTYVRDHPSNLTLNLDGIFFPLYRIPATFSLPLPPLVMAFVWTVTGTRSGLYYLFFIILLEAVILYFFLGMIEKRFSSRVMWILAIALGINVPLGRLVVSISYDVYAYFGALLSFMAGVLLLDRRRAGLMMLASFGAAITVLGREIYMLFFPLASAWTFWLALRERSRDLARRAVLFLLPFVMVLGGLMVYRQITTGSPRPTRSMFWHSVWLGLGQFPNPYGITYDDGAVIDYARTIDPTLGPSDYSNDSPFSRHELTLRNQARFLVRDHPWLLVRNFFLRTLIVISPGMYQGGDSVPPRFAGIVNLISPIGTLFLIWGSVLVFRRDRAAFAMIILTLATEIITFAWFYIVGRVVLLASHVYILPLAVLIDHLLRRKAAGATPART